MMRNTTTTPLDEIHGWLLRMRRNLIATQQDNPNARTELETCERLLRRCEGGAFTPEYEADWFETTFEVYTEDGDFDRFELGCSVHGAPEGVDRDLVERLIPGQAA